MSEIKKKFKKERLNISKSAKFESDLSKASEDIALQRCENLQTFIWQVCTPTIHLSENIVNLRRYMFVSFLTNHFQSSQFY